VRHHPGTKKSFEKKLGREIIKKILIPKQIKKYSGNRIQIARKLHPHRPHNKSKNTDY